MPDLETTGSDLNKTQLGRAIAAARVRADFTQRRLCDELKELTGIEMATSKLCKIEKGGQAPDLNTLTAISIVLGQEKWRQVISGFIDASLSENMLKLSMSYEMDISFRDNMLFIEAAKQAIDGKLSTSRLNSLYEEKLAENRSRGEAIASLLDGISSERREYPEAFVAATTRADKSIQSIISTFARYQILDALREDESFFRAVVDEVEHLNTQATPAPPQGAVAIDEPQGKEHDHEQD